ncbi:OLC1v1016907C1 [Oldenlandia corymbosa var. corymbosa]|uniref:OLC1v1016907C1 n=1 Tax=Oldenlandia corymbosa var. corymbosa TaxID=529605 RepID=A0AAV1E877_OLDCO|nr:OLC1v1016907C1 [Oldenlandia corymbosa var. corymbosa]
MEFGKMGNLLDQDLKNILLITISSIVVIKLISLLFRKPKNAPPGPKGLPIIGHLHLMKKPMHITIHQMAKQYGEIFSLRLGQKPVVVLSSPRAIEECLTKNDVIFAYRNQTVSAKLLNYNCTTIGLASYGDYWRNLRRITAQEIFSQNRIAMFGNIRQEEVRYFLGALLEEYNDAKKPAKVMLRPKFAHLTLNIMMRMIAGKRYYGKDVTDDEAKQFQQVIREMLHFHGVVNLEDYIPAFKFLLFDVKGLKKQMKVLMNKIDSLLQNLVNQHHVRKDGSGQTTNANQDIKKTFMDILLALQDKEPDFLTDQTIKAITLSLLAGGTDTTTSTLEWAMSLLLNNPEAMKKAVEEIDTVVGKDRLLEETDVPKLNYLNNIISETLRLYPPIPLLLPHKSVEDCTLSGYDIPKGTMMMCSLWTIQRDPNLWDEPEKFKPERFDQKDGEGYKLLPFGAGRRACPGANLGKRVVTLALGAMIQGFEFSRIGDEEVDMEQGSGLTMPKANPLEVLFKPRQITVQNFGSQ